MSLNFYENMLREEEQIDRTINQETLPKLSNKKLPNPNQYGP